MLASRPDNIYSMPFTQPFDQSNLDESYSSYPPVTAYRPSFYDPPNFIISGSQDVIKQQYLMPTPEGSPAHSSSHSFDQPPSALSSSGASIPSAASSAMGSPYSNGGLMAQGIDSWSDAATRGLGIGPSIVRQDSFVNESFLQDPSLFDSSDKILSAFVGEYSQISSSPRAMTPVPMSTSTRQLSSPAVSSGCVKTERPSDPAVGSVTEGRQRTPTREDKTFKSPHTPASAKSSVSLASPSSSRAPRPAARGRSGATIPKPKTPKPLNISASVRIGYHGLPELKSPIQASAGFHPSPFFSQSSGNFIAPLQATCWFHFIPIYPIYSVDYLLCSPIDL
jgi:hypothetical protein